MSNYKIHFNVGCIIVGIGFIALIYFKLYKPIYFVTLPYILYLALLPDIDTAKSKARKITNITLFLCMFGLTFTAFIYNINFLLLLIVPIFILLLIKILKHRTTTHNYLFGLIFALPLFILSPYLFFIAFTSFLSHLFLDAL